MPIATAPLTLKLRNGNTALYKMLDYYFLPLAVLLVLFLQRVSIACYAERGISYSKSVRPSVRPSVCPSVTRWH